jgi:hypothetical protein
VYVFALRHASAYNLINADHPSLVAETFCLVPRAKPPSVTVVPSFRPRQPFSLLRWIPRCTRAASSHVRPSHRPTSPPMSPFPPVAPLGLTIEHLAPTPESRRGGGVVAHTRPHTFVTIVGPAGSSAVDQPLKNHTSQLRAAADPTEVVCGSHTFSHVGSHLCMGQLIATYVAAM